MRAPSLHTDSSDTSLSEAGLGGSLTENPTGIMSNFEVGEPSNAAQHVPVSTQPDQSCNVEKVYNSGGFVEGRSQVLRDNVFTTIPVAPLGLFGPATGYTDVTQQTQEELGDNDAISGGKFGNSDRAKSYIPARGFSETFMKRPTHVQPLFKE